MRNTIFSRLSILLSLSLLSLSFLAYGGAPSKKDDEAKARTFKIGVLYWSMGIPGQVAMRKGLEAEADAINAEAAKIGAPGVSLIGKVAGDGEEGIERQIVQMRELIALKVDAIVAQPTDNAALANPLREANAAKIPVVAYDQYISGGELASYITSDNYQAGYLDGEYLASLFPKGGKIGIVFVDYPHVSSTVERADGFIDALDDAKADYKILKNYNAVEPVGGRLAAKEFLADFPKEGSVDAVFTVNDGGGQELMRALLRAGRREIVFASIDGDPATVSLIRDGRVKAIDSAQFCGPLGAEAIRVAYSILCGKKAAKRILVPVFPVTKETAPLYPGWDGPIPKAFKKPWKSVSPLWDPSTKALDK